MSTQPILVPISKVKLIKLLIFSIIFVALGIWIIIARPEVSNAVLDNAVVKYGAAAGSLLMGVAGTIFFTLKMFDNKPGLIIDSKGITDNASGVSAGFIPWEDIRQIYTTQVMSEKFIMIGVSNPEKYIDRQTKFLKRKAMNYNYKAYGSPISLTVSALKTNHDSLLATLNAFWDVSKKS